MRPAMNEQAKLALVLHLAQCQPCREAAHRRMAARHSSQLRDLVRKLAHSENELTLKDGLISAGVLLGMGAWTALIYHVMAVQ